MSKKKEDSIKLSPKHGLNPSITKCFLCNKDIGIALMGKMNKNDDEAPKECYTGELCDKCEKKLNTTHTLIMEYSAFNKTRTGRYVLVDKECIKEDLRKNPIMLCEEEMFNELFVNKTIN